MADCILCRQHSLDLAGSDRIVGCCTVFPRAWLLDRQIWAQSEGGQAGLPAIGSLADAAALAWAVRQVSPETVVTHSILSV